MWKVAKALIKLFDRYSFFSLNSVIRIYEKMTMTAFLLILTMMAL